MWGYAHTPFLLKWTGSSLLEVVTCRTPECVSWGLSFQRQGKSTSKLSQDKKDRVAGSECYSWILNWLETFLWTRWAMRLMHCTGEGFLPSHTSLEQGGHRLLGHQSAPSAPCPQSNHGVSGAAVPTGQGERGADRGGNTCEEHRAGINHAGKVPKKIGVPSGVPALAGIEQHRPIPTECTKLHLKHSSFLSRIY